MLISGKYRWRQLMGEAPGRSTPADGETSTRPLEPIAASLFDRLPIGLFCIDNESNRLVMANREFSRITQHPHSALVGMPWEELVAPEDLERIRDYRSRRLAGDLSLPASYELLLITRHGDRRVVVFQTDIVPLEDAILGTAVDITRDKLETDILHYTQRADSLAALAGGIGNEFNNLLAVISGYVQLLQVRSPDRPELKDPLFHIAAAVDKAIRQTEALLLFARRGSNAMEPVDMVHLVRRVLAVLPALDSKDISVHMNCEDSRTVVRGDGTQLEQVLLCLLANAVEAVPAGRGRIEISLMSRAVRREEGLPLEPGNFVSVSIRDNGPGIPEEHLPRLFHPFFTTKDPSKHPGLGLPIAHGLVRKHGGQITVDSSRAGGSVFRILLPKDPSPSDLVPVSLAQPGSPLPRPRRILVIDDQEIVGEFVEEVLTSAGYEATHEPSARTAFNAILRKRIHPELLIVDMMMPDMDGRTLIRELHAAGHDIPTIATSGFTSPQEGDHELKGLLKGYLKKPFKVEALLSLVGQVLDAHKSLPQDNPPV